MKRLITLLALGMALLPGLQLTAQTYHVIYVDNSRVTTEDGLNDMVFTKLLAQFDAIKANPADKFLFFVSNGKSFTYTDNQNSVEKMIEQAFLNNPQKMPDQAYDLGKLRDNLSRSLTGFKGQVKFTAYVSENLAYKVADSYSPLFSFFPAELMAISGQNALALALYYPKLNGRVKEDALLQSLNFYNTGEFQSNITFTVKGL